MMRTECIVIILVLGIVCFLPTSAQEGKKIPEWAFNWRVGDWWEITFGSEMGKWRISYLYFKVVAKEFIDINGEQKDCFVLLIFRGTKQEMEEEMKRIKKTGKDNLFEIERLYYRLYISTYDYSLVKVEVNSRIVPSGYSTEETSKRVIKHSVLSIPSDLALQDYSPGDRAAIGLIYPRISDKVETPILHESNNGISYYLLQKGYPWIVKQEYLDTRRGDYGWCWILESFAVLTRTSMHGELNIDVLQDHLLAKKDLDSWYKQQKPPKDSITLYALKRSIGRRIIGLEQFKEEYSFDWNKRPHPAEYCPYCGNLTTAIKCPCSPHRWLPPIEEDGASDGSHRTTEVHEQSPTPQTITTETPSRHPDASESPSVRVKETSRPSGVAEKKTPNHLHRRTVSIGLKRFILPTIIIAVVVVVFFYFLLLRRHKV